MTPQGSDINFLWGYLGTIAKLGPLARSASSAGVRGMVDRLLTHLLSLRSAVCAVTNVMVDVGVVVGAVGAETVVVTLLVMIFARVLVLVVLWRCPSKEVSIFCSLGECILLYPGL